MAKADPFVRERQRGELRLGVPDAITMFPPQDVFGLFGKGGGMCKTSPELTCTT